MIDWGVIRTILNAAAGRFGVDAPDYQLMDFSSVRSLADAADSTPLCRAMMFGADQLALQHRGLWDLLEARQQARGIY